MGRETHQLEDVFPLLLELVDQHSNSSSSTIDTARNDQDLIPIHYALQKKNISSLGQSSILPEINETLTRAKSQAE
jgi:hypothetical protein